MPIRLQPYGPAAWCAADPRHRGVHQGWSRGGRGPGHPGTPAPCSTTSPSPDHAVIVPHGIEGTLALIEILFDNSRMGVVAVLDESILDEPTPDGLASDGPVPDGPVPD